ncbi:tetratricopeptide repeat protein [Spirochaeta dissipatitropha]
MIKLMFRICTIMLLFNTAVIYSSPVDNVRSGRIFLNSGNYIEAIGEYRKAIESNPHYLDAWQGLAETYLAMQEFDQALSSIERARVYAGSSLPVKNLHADILLSIGRINDAAAVYAEVRRQEPNNTAAIIGEAQIALARNNPDRAARIFDEALQQNPGNRNALLSLALISSAAGDHQAAGRYIDSALQHHNNNPTVHLLAAQQFMERNNLEQAEYHASVALQLREHYPDALLLSAEINLEKNDYATADRQIRQILERNPQSVEAWYLAGYAAYRENRIDEALTGMERALRLSPGNELLRGIYETILRRETSLTDSRRQAAADYHIQLAGGYQDQHLSQRARAHYRRALQLNPFSERGRLGYASSFEADGNYARYLEELRLLREQGNNSRDVADSIEMYSNMIAGSVAERWSINQFDLERASVGVQLFVLPGSTGLYNADLFLPYIIIDNLNNIHSVNFSSPPVAVTSHQEALQMARSGSSEYYIVLEPLLDGSTVRLGFTIAVSRTGSRISESWILREGAHSFSRALSVIQEILRDSMPVIARIVERRFRNAVIDRGTLDGISVGDEIPIHPAQTPVARNDSPGLLLPDKELLAVFVVEELDDRLSSGRITQGGFFDRVNPGDYAIIQPAGTGEQNPVLTDFSPLYRRIRSLD